ncbi:hypothetical protein Clacol_010333 [Clathrus columnatus]|uniref:Uncharacterized protein n=1 Tax=Clathrus columnatus TaxID=1419009 RepID=A0AAV5ASC7_9AGAM|nr:hypothetical protein Clacol_010333 [Clathrus columnatus]
MNNETVPTLEDEMISEDRAGTLRQCDVLNTLADVIAALPLLGTQENPVIPLRIHDISILLFETLGLITIIRRVWGLWKLKQSLGLQSNKDLATSLLRQDHEEAQAQPEIV